MQGASAVAVLPSVSEAEVLEHVDARSWLRGCCGKPSEGHQQKAAHKVGGTSVSCHMIYQETAHVMLKILFKGKNTTFSIALGYSSFCHKKGLWRKASHQFWWNFPLMVERGWPLKRHSRLGRPAHTFGSNSRSVHLGSMTRSAKVCTPRSAVPTFGNRPKRHAGRRCL